jgi:hypothetical protein
MTREETARVVAAIQLLWPHSNLGGAPADVVSMWHSFLGEFPHQAVDAAVRELSAQGREHAPPVGVVAKTVATRAVDPPDWDEVWTEIEQLLKRYHPGFPNRETPPAGAFSHPLIAAFAVPSWRELALGPASGTKDHGTFYAQQREAWKAFAHRSQRSVALGAVGAPRRRGELQPFSAVRGLLTGEEAA